MAEIIAEPSALSKVIPVSFKVNDTDSVTTTRLATKKQFNTTDTDAWLSFTLDGIETTSGEFDLTLINVDENPSSIFHHTSIAFPGIPFHYKLDASEDLMKNEIRHAGRWIGQVIIRLANGDTTTRQFDFAIAGHLLDGKEARVILIEDYNALIATITASKTELEGYNIDYAALIADVDAKEALREQAEIDRAATFDALVESEMVAQNVATKLAEKEATFAPRMLSLESELADKRDKSVKIKGIDMDTATDANKVKLVNLSEEVQATMAGTAPVISAVADGSLTNTKYAVESISHDKVDLYLKKLIRKDFNPISATFQTGYFLYNKTSFAVSISTVANFQYSNPIFLPKGKVILLQCKGYNDVVATIVSCNEDGSNLKALAVSATSDLAFFQYTAKEDLFVRVSGQVANFNMLATFDDTNNVDYKNKVDVMSDDLYGVLKPTYIEHDGKYVTPLGALNVQSLYTTSDIIELKIGEKLTFKALGSSVSGVVSMLSKWTEDGNTFVKNLYTTKGVVETVDYVATEDVEHLRISYMKGRSTSVPLSAYITNSDYLDFKNIMLTEIADMDKEYLGCLINNVTTVGDSLTAGGYYGFDYNGDAIKENYPYMLAKLSHWNVTNVSSNGATPTTWITRHAATTDFASSDVVIIGLGTNGGLTDTIEVDTANSIFAQTETGQYCWIVNEFKSQNPDAHIFLGKIFGASHSALTNSVIEKIASKYGCKVLDDSELYGNPIMHPFGNTLHYGKIGNLHKANLYLSQIKEHIYDNLTDYEVILEP